MPRLPEQLHARARIPQLIGSFVAIWDEILPPLPEGCLASEPRRRRGGRRLSYDVLILGANLTVVAIAETIAERL